MNCSFSLNVLCSKILFFISYSSHWYTAQPLEATTLENMLTRILAVREIHNEQEAAHSSLHSPWWQFTAIRTSAHSHPAYDLLWGWAPHSEFSPSCHSERGRQVGETVRDTMKAQLLTKPHTFQELWTRWGDCISSLGGCPVPTYMHKEFTNTDTLISEDGPLNRTLSSSLISITLEGCLCLSFIKCGMFIHDSNGPFRCPYFTIGLPKY